MKHADYIAELNNIIHNGDDKVAAVNALRLMAELENLLPKPYILYDGDQKDAKEAQQSKASLLKKLIAYIKKIN